MPRWVSEAGACVNLGKNQGVEAQEKKKNKITHPEKKKKVRLGPWKENLGKKKTKQKGQNCQQREM